jgi:hypothetical protein
VVIVSPCGPRFVGLVAKDIAQVGDRRVEIGKRRGSKGAERETGDCRRRFVTSQPAEEGGEGSQRASYVRGVARVVEIAERQIEVTQRRYLSPCWASTRDKLVSGDMIDGSAWCDCSSGAIQKRSGADRRGVRERDRSRHQRESRHNGAAIYVGAQDYLSWPVTVSVPSR